MIVPSPYGRPPRGSFKVDRRKVADTLPALCPPEVLELELVERFARAEAPTLCVMFRGWRPNWAWEAYGRCLDKGLLREDDYDGRVAVTARGWSELEASRG